MEDYKVHYSKIHGEPCSPENGKTVRALSASDAAKEFGRVIAGLYGVNYFFRNYSEVTVFDENGQNVGKFSVGVKISFTSKRLD